MLTEWSQKISGNMPYIPIADLLLLQNKQLCEKFTGYGEDTQFRSFDHYLQQTQDGVPTSQPRQPAGNA